MTHPLPISPTTHFSNFLLSPVLDLKRAVSDAILKLPLPNKLQITLTFSGMDILHQKKIQIAFGSASPKVLAPHWKLLAQCLLYTFSLTHWSPTSPEWPTELYLQCSKGSLAYSLGVFHIPVSNAYKPHGQDFQVSDSSTPRYQPSLLVTFVIAVTKFLTKRIYSDLWWDAQADCAFMSMYEIQFWDQPHGSESKGTCCANLTTWI